MAMAVAIARQPGGGLGPFFLADGLEPFVCLFFFFFTGSVTGAALCCASMSVLMSVPVVQ